MKNILLYTSNNNAEWVKKTVNSINSFFYFNPELKQNTTAVVITDQNGAAEIDMSKIHSGIQWQVIDQLSFDYTSLGLTNNIAKSKFPILYRFEPFMHPLFDDCDNVLSMDGDVEFLKPCSELMYMRRSSMIGFTFESDFGEKHNLTSLNINWYPNMGFMLLTPKLIGVETRHKMFNDLIDAVKQHFMFSNYPDQGAMAVVFNKNAYGCQIVDFGPIYNYHPWSLGLRTISKDQVAIVHHITDKNYPLRYI